MPYALNSRSLLTLDELSARDVDLLIELAHDLKRERNQGHERQQLRGLHIATLASAETPGKGTALETAAIEQGAMVVRIGPHEVRKDVDDDADDLPRLLGRLYDAIEVRDMPPARLRDFALHCGVPVYSNVDHRSHPTRLVADLMTIQEHVDKPLAQTSMAWLGDPRGEDAATLLPGALLMGMDVRIAAARAALPAGDWLARLKDIASASHARLSLFESTHEAMASADFCYAEADRRPLCCSCAQPVLQPLQGVAPATGGDNFALRAAANRIHAIKAVLVATLA